MIIVNSQFINDSIETVWRRGGGAGAVTDRGDIGGWGGATTKGDPVGGGGGAP